MKRIVILGVVGLLAGCATGRSNSKVLNKLTEGMNQNEAENVMGPAADIREPAENAQGRMVNIWSYKLYDSTLALGGAREYNLYWVGDRLVAWAPADKMKPEDLRALQLDLSANDDSREYIRRRVAGVNTFPPAPEVAIDGMWKRNDYQLRFKQGLGELVFETDNPFNGKPFFKEITRTDAGKYTCKNLAWNDAKREIWYDDCAITLKSPTELSIEYKGKESFTETFELVSSLAPAKLAKEAAQLPAPAPATDATH